MYSMYFFIFRSHLFPAFFFEPSLALKLLARGKPLCSHALCASLSITGRVAGDEKEELTTADHGHPLTSDVYDYSFTFDYSIYPGNSRGPPQHINVFRNRDSVALTAASVLFCVFVFLEPEYYIPNKVRNPVSWTVCAPAHW